MISLRDYKETDIDRLVSLANNKHVTHYMIDTFVYPYTRDDAIFWITEGSTANGSINKVILLDGLFVGAVGINPQQGWRSHCAEIGYWIGEDYWGRGIATRALEMMTAEAFDHFHFKKLYAPVLAPNTRSIRVLEKAGYQREGILKNEVSKHDQYFDIYQYATSCL